MTINNSLLIVLFAVLTLPAFSQLCEELIVPPATMNGLEVSSTSTGSVSTFADPYTSCGNYSTPANSVWLGSGGEFSYTVQFSEPVNNVKFVINAAGQGINEVFTFTTTSGNPWITTVSSCFSSVNGNVISSGLNADPNSLGGGGVFIVSASTSYTAVTINGPGGSAGSLMAICAISVSDPISICEWFSNLSHLEIPNVITPNGDQINDEFSIPESYSSCYDYELKIFNRWGNSIFEGTKSTAFFNGKDANGESVSQGVYFYTFSSNNQRRNGYFSIL
jgi:gliding motility-associated-like protein